MDETRDPESEVSSIGTLVADDAEIDAPAEEAELPSTHRVADGSEVSPADARQAWAEAAVPVLEGVAGTYN
ncbi:MAG: hypothetical protein ACR2JF_18735, partial [Iamia sp.]